MSYLYVIEKRVMPAFIGQTPLSPLYIMWSKEYTAFTFQMKTLLPNEINVWRFLNNNNYVLSRKYYLQL